MDGPSYLSWNEEQSCIAVRTVNEQSKETVKTVANTLAAIGDELSQTYEISCDSGVNAVMPCAVLEGWLNLVVLLTRSLS